MPVDEALRDAGAKSVIGLTAAGAVVNRPAQHQRVVRYR